MIAPNVVTLGGGLSKAFNCFKERMFTAIEENAPAFNRDNTIIVQSQLGEKSSILGASIVVKNKLS